MSTAARLPSGMQAGRAIKPAKVRNVDLGQHYAELPAKHETGERFVDVCWEGKLNEFDVTKDFHRRASAYGHWACGRRSLAR